jgi:hypothetical protein
MNKFLLYILRVILIALTLASAFICLAVLASSHNIPIDVKLRFIGAPICIGVLTVASFWYPKKYRVGI